MRILHAPNEIGVNMQLTAQAQRELGHDATTLDIGTGFFSQGDIMLHTRGSLGVQNEEKRNAIWKTFLEEHLYAYDVYHFYFVSTLFWDFKDLELLRKAGKIIVMTCCGSDIVNHSPELMKYFAAQTQGKTAPKPPMMRPEQYKSVATVDRYVHAFLAGSLRIDHLPRIALMKRTQRGWAVPIHIAEWDEKVKNASLEDKDPNKIYIIHAPTHRYKKGTEYILPTIETLQKEGYPIELILVEGVPQNEVHRLFAKADIAIDQLFIGYHGAFALQMMTLGKPVIARMDPYLTTYQGLSPPIVHADPKTLYSELVRLIKNPQRRQDLGQQGRRYVEEYHDHRTMGQDTIDLYNDLIHGQTIQQIPNPLFYTQKIREIFPNPLPPNATYEEEILQKRVHNFTTNQEMLQIYKQLGWLHQAIPFLQRLTEINPHDFNSHLELALYHLDRFRCHKARPYLEKCLELNPEFETQFLNLARQRIEKERYNEAVTLLSILHQHNPDEVTYPYALGTIYATLQLWSRAEMHFYQALAINPGHQPTRDHLQVVYKKLEKNVDIEELAQNLQPKK